MTNFIVDPNGSALAVEGSGFPMPGAFQRLLPDYCTELERRRCSPNTVRQYRVSVQTLIRHCHDAGLADDPRVLSEAELRRFLYLLEQRLAPASFHVRYRGVMSFFDWMLKEGEIEVNPLRAMSFEKPKMYEQSMDVLTIDQVQRLFEAVKASRYEHRAMLRVFIDCGLRVSEMAGVRRADVDLVGGRLYVREPKGGRHRGRYVGLGHKSKRELDRWIRRHPGRGPGATLDELPLWTATTSPTIRQRVRKWGIDADIIGLHPHTLRHTWAHLYRESGGSVEDLMKLGGWRDPSTMARYGAKWAEIRAINSYANHSPGDMV